MSSTDSPQRSNDHAPKRPVQSPFPRKPAPCGLLTLLVCFFLSGASALFYQVCWIRLSVAIFGSHIFAISTVVAVFFAGMAIGSLLSGKISQYLTRPLAVYAWLELLIGIFGFASPPLFSLIDLLYGSAYPWVSHSFLLTTLVRLVLVSLALIVPTILMGATLPLCIRHLADARHRLIRTAGVLYGANTLGAAIGVLLGGLISIRFFGITQTIFIAAGTNILIFLVIHSQSSVPTPHGEHRTLRFYLQLLCPRSRESLPKRSRIVGGLVFLTGFVALSFEIIWTRFLAVLLSWSVGTYTLTIAMTLFGIVIGSLAASWCFDRIAHKATLFASIQALSAVATLALLLAPAGLWTPWLESGSLFRQLSGVALLLFIPTCLSGMSFPLAIDLATTTISDSPRSTGYVAAMNTVGGIVGSLATGFLILPILGLHVAALIITGTALAIAYIAWFSLDSPTRPHRRLVLASIPAILWLLFLVHPPTHLPHDILRLGNPDTLLSLAEGRTADAAVFQRGQQKYLTINRLWQGSSDNSHQALAAHIPLLLHDNPKQCLVIGLGAGQTARNALLHPITDLDCVEIEESLVPLIQQHFDAGWLQDPRFSLVIDDGRNFVRHADAKYDVIIVEVGQIYRPGTAPFYTAEFYRAARERLAKGGIISQFVPLRFFSTDQFRMIIATFVQTFPNAMLWYNTSELLLLGSTGSPISIPKPELDSRLARPEIEQSLSYSYWGGAAHSLHLPDNFISGFISGAEELSRLSGGYPIYHDNRPTLEYSVPGREFPILPTIQLIRSHLGNPTSILEGSGDTIDLEHIESMRAYNLSNIVAEHLYSKAQQQLKQNSPFAAVDTIRQALAWNPKNLKLRNDLGLLLLMRADYEAAVAQFSQAVEIAPEGDTSLLNLGNALCLAGHHSSGIAKIQAVIERSPDLPEAHFNLGVAYSSLNQPQNAIPHLRTAWNLAPTNHSYATALIDALQASGQHTEAAEVSRRIANLPKRQE